MSQKPAYILIYQLNFNDSALSCHWYLQFYTYSYAVSLRCCYSLQVQAEGGYAFPIN